MGAPGTRRLRGEGFSARSASLWLIFTERTAVGVRLGEMSMYWRLSLFIASVLGVAMPVALAQTPMKVLHVVPSADLQELDPTRAANQIGRIYSQMVFDTLFALDHTLSPKPMMVESETVSPDHLTYRFTLRPGLKFH